MHCTNYSILLEIMVYLFLISLFYNLSNQCSTTVGHELGTFNVFFLEEHSRPRCWAKSFVPVDAQTQKPDRIVRNDRDSQALKSGVCLELVCV